MRFKLFVLIALSAILSSVDARFMHSRHSPKSKSNAVQEVDNPMKAIINVLEGDQKAEFIKLARSNRELKKSEAKQKVDEFVTKLSTELQNKIKGAMIKIDEQIAARDKKLLTLSQKAQDLFGKINDLVKDDSISKKEEIEKVQEIIKSADKDLLKEFKDAGIQLPDAPQEKDDKDKKKHRRPIRGPGGYLGAIYFRLTPKQKAEVNKIVVQRNSLSKKEMRDQITAFVKQLPNELQKKFKAAKDEHVKKLSKDKETVKKMSNEAQKLYEEVMAVEKDGSITFRQEEVKIHQIVKQADKKIIDEFREKEVGIPTIPLRKPDKQNEDKDKNKDDEKNQNEGKDDSNKDITTSVEKDETKSNETKNNVKSKKSKRSNRSRFNKKRRQM